MCVVNLFSSSCHLACQAIFHDQSKCLERVVRRWTLWSLLWSLRKMACWVLAFATSRPQDNMPDIAITQVKSAHKPSGSSGQRLSLVFVACPHPPWMGCQSIAVLPPVFNSPVPKNLAGERDCESLVSFPGSQPNVPGQGSNPDRSIQRQAH